jgi:hypothetical protein
MEEDADPSQCSGRRRPDEGFMMKPQHRFIITVIAVGVAFLLAAVIIGTIFAPTNGTIEFELLKLIIQFLLIIALGAVVAVGVEVVKRRLESEASQRQYEVDTLTSLLAQLDELYREVRRERRSLGLQIPMSYKKYNKGMRRLNDRKQGLEHLWRDEMQVLENWLPAIHGTWSYVKEMEDYLGRMEDEWKAVARAPNERLNAPLTELSAFLATGRSDSNFADFRGPYLTARRVLVESLSVQRTGKRLERSYPDRRQATAPGGLGNPIQGRASAGGRDAGPVGNDTVSGRDMFKSAVEQLRFVTTMFWQQASFFGSIKLNVGERVFALGGEGG